MVIKKKEHPVDQVALDLINLRETVERIGDILTFFKLELLVPYIRNSEQAKVLGISINEHGRLERLYLSPADELIFPGGERLIALFDISREYLVEKYSDEDEVLRFEKSCVQEYVLCANWRTSCKRYLNAILEDTDKAVKMFIDEKTPWILHSALMSLGLYCFDNMPSEYLNQAANLVIAWKFVHCKR